MLDLTKQAAFKGEDVCGFNIKTLFTLVIQRGNYRTNTFADGGVAEDIF